MDQLTEIAKRFTKLDSALMAQRLERPGPNARVIIDTDTANEIDDQYALAWALLSPERLNLEGVTAVPFSFAHHQEDLIKSVNIMRNGGPKDAVEEKFMWAVWVAGLSGSLMQIARLKTFYLLAPKKVPSYRIRKFCGFLINAEWTRAAKCSVAHPDTYKILTLR